MQFNSAGNKVASLLADGTVRVYRVSDGLPLGEFPSGDGSFQEVGWLGDRVFRWSQTHGAELFTMESHWKLERTIGGPREPLLSDRVTAIDFHRDGLALAVGSGEPSRFGEVKIFATETGELLRDYDRFHSDVVLCLDFSPDGQVLASSAADKTVRLIDWTTGETIGTLEGHTHHVLSFDWRLDGQVVASAGADRVVKVWDIDSGRAIRTIGGFPEELSAVEFVKDTPQIVASSINGTVRLSDANNGNTIRGFDTGGDFIYALAATPDGQLLLGGGQNGKLRIWKIADGNLLKEVP